MGKCCDTHALKDETVACLGPNLCVTGMLLTALQSHKTLIQNSWDYLEVKIKCPDRQQELDLICPLN